MVPVISEIVGAILGLVIGAVCVRELVVSGYRRDLLALAILAFVIALALLRRLFQIVKEVRALVSDMDH